MPNESQLVACVFSPSNCNLRGGLFGVEVESGGRGFQSGCQDNSRENKQQRKGRPPRNEAFDTPADRFDRSQKAVKVIEFRKLQLFREQHI